MQTVLGSRGLGLRGLGLRVLHASHAAQVNWHNGNIVALCPFDGTVFCHPKNCLWMPPCNNLARPCMPQQCLSDWPTRLQACWCCRQWGHMAKSGSRQRAVCSHSIESLVSRSNRGTSLAWIGESSYNMAETILD